MRHLATRKAGRLANERRNSNALEVSLAAASRVRLHRFLRGVRQDRPGYRSETCWELPKPCPIPSLGHWHSKETALRSPPCGPRIDVPRVVNRAAIPGPA